MSTADYLRLVELKSYIVLLCSQNLILHFTDGVLDIEASKRKIGSRDYISGRVDTKGKADFLFGNFEFKAKIPAGKTTHLISESTEKSDRNVHVYKVNYFVLDCRSGYLVHFGADTSAMRSGGALPRSHCASGLYLAPSCEINRKNHGFAFSKYLYSFWCR